MPISPQPVTRIDRSRPPRGAGRGGFSFIELMMVIAIITVLMGLLGTAISMVRQRVFVSQATGRIAQLQWALDNYATEDRRHRFPPQTGPGDLTIRYDPSGATPGNFNALMAEGHQLDLSAFDRSVPPPYPLLDPWRRPYQYQVDSDLITFPTPQRPLPLPDWNTAGARPFAYLWSVGAKARADGVGWIYTKDTR